MWGEGGWYKQVCDTGSLWAERERERERERGGEGKAEGGRGGKRGTEREGTMGIRGQIMFSF